MATNVFPADYATVPVFEYTTEEGSFILRRQFDSYINVTHLLNIAGLPRKQIRSILDEICANDTFEKINVGNWKYQGTYIPLESALKIAKDVNVYDKVEPIFEIDLALKMPVQPVNTSSIDPPAPVQASAPIAGSFETPDKPKRKIKEQEISRKRQSVATTSTVPLEIPSSGSTEEVPKSKLVESGFPRPDREIDPFLKADDALYEIFKVLYENDPKGLGMPIKLICIELLKINPEMKNITKNFSAFVSGKILFYLRKIDSRNRNAKYILKKQHSSQLNAFIYKYLGAFEVELDKIPRDTVPSAVLKKRKEKQRKEKQKTAKKKTAKSKRKQTSIEKEKGKEKEQMTEKEPDKLVNEKSDKEAIAVSNISSRRPTRNSNAIVAVAAPSHTQELIDAQKKVQDLEIKRLHEAIETLKSSLQKVNHVQKGNILVDELKSLKVEVSHLNLNYDKQKGNIAMLSLFKRNTELSSNNSKLMDENSLLKEQIAILRNEKKILEKSAVEKGTAEIESLESELDAEIQNVENLIASDETLKTEVAKLPRTDTLIGGYKQLVETRILYQERKYQKKQLESDMKIKRLQEEISELNQMISEAYKLIHFKEEVISVDRSLIEEYSKGYR
ncbi:hypothetical protein CLIB1423_37S00386 [[Candida] railenensis]|uniref:HTH APSES-type domain-containing protein n=1 Tax=[Candida] railenensis TaxID=45579 RepID=A0A9P0QVS9_9ASCO|nr:hypothetical protein CLIB1423_37S00386 [[Candida] railenensis]